MAFGLTCGFVLHNEQMDSSLEVHRPDRSVKIAFILIIYLISAQARGLRGATLLKNLDEDRKRQVEQQVRLREVAGLFFPLLLDRK